MVGTLISAQGRGWEGCSLPQRTLSLLFWSRFSLILAACCWHPQSCVAYFPFNVQIVHRCHRTGIPELCLFSGPLQSGI
uniref:Secreted protein n=1 Tax=Anguilla anguilla TaxID=7936 RepID=A0A0E9VWR0_ANGAN